MLHGLALNLASVIGCKALCDTLVSHICPTAKLLSDIDEGTYLQ
jgi:hypothetical protein